jgi:hypothetical protein
MKGEIEVAMEPTTSFRTEVHDRNVSGIIE